MDFDFSKAIEWFESTGFYKDLLSKLPVPLNNPVFCGIVLIVLLVFLAFSIVEHINNYRIRRRIKRKNREYEEKRIDDKLQQAEEKAQSKDMEKYLQLMMVTQMQNMTSSQGATSEPQKVQPDTQNVPQVEVKEPPSEIDHITGLANDFALEKALDNYDTAELSILTIGVNRSKKGRLSESELMKTIADTMCDVWSKNKCFRTGNTFLVLSTKEFRRSIEKEIHTFKDYLGDLKNLVAVGLADASDVEGRASVEKIRKASEQAMCVDKNSSGRKSKQEEDAPPVEVTGLSHIFNNYKKDGGATS